MEKNYAIDLPFSVDYLGAGLIFIPFCSVGNSNNGTIMFVGTKRNKSILYPISTNTQWGLVSFSMSECMDTCSSFERPIRNNFPLLILSSSMNFSNLWIKYDKQQYYEDNKPIVTFPHQSEV